MVLAGWAWILLGFPRFACIVHSMVGRSGFALLVFLAVLTLPFGTPSATNWPFLGLESCWGFLVSHASSTPWFAVPHQVCELYHCLPALSIPGFCLACLFSGFDAVVRGPLCGQIGLSIGHYEACWDFPVSHASATAWFAVQGQWTNWLSPGLESCWVFLFIVTTSNLNEAHRSSSLFWCVTSLPIPLLDMLSH